MPPGPNFRAALFTISRGCDGGQAVDQPMRYPSKRCCNKNNTKIIRKDRYLSKVRTNPAAFPRPGPGVWVQTGPNIIKARQPLLTGGSRHDDGPVRAEGIFGPQFLRRRSSTKGRAFCPMPAMTVTAAPKSACASRSGWARGTTICCPPSVTPGHHVAAGGLPFIAPLNQGGTDQAPDGRFVRA